jgi:hypothetical protein
MKIKLPDKLNSALNWYNKTIAPIITAILVIWAQFGDTLTPYIPAAVLTVLIPILSVLQRISKVNIRNDEQPIPVDESEAEASLVDSDESVQEENMISRGE